MNEWVAITAGLLVVSLVGLFFVLRISGPRTFLIRIGEIVCTGVFACGVTLLLGETGVLRKFVNRELGRTVIDKVVDPDFLRDAYSSKRIKEIRMAATQAMCLATVDVSPGSFLDLIEHTIYPMLDSSIQRYDLTVTYTQQPQERQGQRIFKVSHIIDAVYKNPCLEPTSFTQRIVNTMEPVPGVEPEELFKISEFLINGEPVLFDLHMEILQDGRYRFSGQRDFQIRDKLIFHMKQEKYIPKDDYFTFWMTIPTKGIEVRFQHPVDYEPRFFAYGLGAEYAKHEVNEPGLDVWKYDGWLLKKHGIFLYWRRE